MIPALPAFYGTHNRYTFRSLRDRFAWYTSVETGRIEIYVQPFPPTGAKWQISTDGGAYGHWTRGGSEIIYNANARKLMSVDVKLGAAFQAGIPKEIFQTPGTNDNQWNFAPNAHF
jgi:hypothetical protein